MRNPRNETLGVTLPSRSREGPGDGLSGPTADGSFVERAKD